MIPQAAPQRRIARFRSQIDAAIASVLDGTTYILGAQVDAFEAEFAAYCGLPFCVGTASGTDALALALRAVGVRPGDEVITTALSAPATAQAILHSGASPRFVDVNRATRCIDPLAVAAAVNARTAAIVPVHLFGHPCDMPALMTTARRHGLAVVEDCAQSHGATLGDRKLGTFGDAAAYSFYPTKNLGGIGDGGAVVTADAAVADTVRSLRNYGFGTADRVSRTTGFNSRLDEIQAAVLRALLPHLDDANAERRRIADRYRAALGDLSVGLPPEARGAVYHQFAVTCADRDGLARHLARYGIATMVHYAPGLHRHPAFAGGMPLQLPEAERLADSLLSLPIQPEVAAGTADRITARLADFAVQCLS